MLKVVLPMRISGGKDTLMNPTNPSRRAFLKSMALTAGALALSGTLPAAEKAPSRKPNIIFFLADDLGYAEVGCYGQKKIKTPNIDRLAAEGLKFSRFYSGSTVCAPARCVLLTGKHTGHSYIRDNGELPTEGQRPIPPDTETIGRMLQQSGYKTGVVGKWGLGGPGSTGEPNQQGFDHWFGYLCQRVAHNYYPRYLWRNGEKVMLEGNDAGLTGKQYAPDLMAEEALQFIRSNKNKPFFLYYATIVPHAALQVPEDSLNEYKGKLDEQPYNGDKGYLPHPNPRSAYAAMVTRFDRDVGRVMALLKELGLDDNTLVFFTSDNGPTFNGGTDSTFFESAGLLRGLKQSLYEGGIRVPMIARWPGRIKPGSHTDQTGAFWDVMPTLAEVTGAKCPADVDGISFLPTLLGKPGQEQHDYLYWENAGKQAVRMGDWKAVRVGLKRNPDAPVQLFDLKTDLGEKTDVAAQHPDVVAKIARIMKEGRTESELFPLYKPYPRPAPTSAAATPAAESKLSSLPSIPKKDWKLVRVDSESKFNDKLGADAFDGDPNTWWHTEFQDARPGHPHEIVIDLGKAREIQGFRYLPRTDSSTNGMIEDFEFYVSDKPDQFGTPAAKGKFTAAKQEQEFTFSKRTGRYVCLKALSEINGKPFTSAAELSVLGE